MKEDTQKSGQLEMFWLSFLDFERERTFFSIASTQAEKQKSKRCKIFFLGGCCMAQRLCCPGGRPSVSYERIRCRNNPRRKNSKSQTKPRCSLPESARGWSKGGLFKQKLSPALHSFQSHLDRPKLCLLRGG